MFDTLFERETGGTLKALTLEWQCPRCQGLNFRILKKGIREAGLYHTRCRYCKAKFRVSYQNPDRFIPGEDEFMERISDDDFTAEEQLDMIKDYAEIEYLKVDRASNGVIKEKQKALEDKITFAKRRRR